MKEFVVVRICNKQDGTAAIPVTGCDTEAEGLKEYFRQCGLAVDSTHLVDSVALLNKYGFQLKYESFEHAAAE